MFPESIETLHHCSASVFPFNLERQGGYQHYSAGRAVIAAGVTTKYNLFTSSFFKKKKSNTLFQQNGKRTGILLGKQNQASQSCHLH